MPLVLLHLADKIIFPHLRWFASLLACRAVCKRWHDRLMSSPVWDPFISEMARLWLPRECVMISGFTDVVCARERAMRIAQNIANNKYHVEEVEYASRIDEHCEVHLVADSVGWSVYQVRLGGWKVFYDRFACIEDGFNGTIVCFDLASNPVRELVRCSGVYAKLDINGSVIAMVVEPICGGVTLEGVFCRPDCRYVFLWSLGIEATATFCRHMKLIDRGPFRVFSDEEMEEEEEEEEERDAYVDKEEFFALCCQGSLFVTKITATNGYCGLRVYDTRTCKLERVISRSDWNVGEWKSCKHALWSDFRLEVNTGVSIFFVDVHSGHVWEDLFVKDELFSFAFLREFGMRDNFTGALAVTDGNFLRDNLLVTAGKTSAVVPDCFGFQVLSFERGVVLLNHHVKLKVIRFDNVRDETFEPVQKKAK
jgi:hypothetical protein